MKITTFMRVGLGLMLMLGMLTALPVGLANAAAPLNVAGTVDLTNRVVSPPLPAGCPVATSTTFTSTTPLAIPTGPGVVTATITVSGAGPYLWDLDLQTFLTHSFAADLDITIQSPAGTVVTLTTDNGIGHDDVYNGTLWDDDANPGGQVPYTTNNGLAADHAYVNLALASPLVPEEALGAFIGENPNGDWVLTISDDLAGDGGTLNSWSLMLTTLPAALTTTTTPFTTSTSLAIPTGPAVVTSTITVSSLGTLLTDVNLTTFITHTYPGDLDITLQSPAGTVVTLTTDNGAGNDDVFNGTLWDDDANPGGQVPYVNNNGLATDHAYVNLALASLLVPEEALGAFIGENPNGDWVLTISDDLASDGGTLNSWSLNIGMGNCLPPDVTPPTVIFGTGSLPPSNGANLPTGPAQLVVYFSENVFGDGSPSAANSLWNYLLVSPGPNGDFDTTITSRSICDSDHVVDGDDQRIFIDSITYDAATFSASLNINGGVALPNGTYRLYLCGAASIDDLSGNPLNGGANSAVNFIVAPASLPAVAAPATGFTPGRVTLLPEQSLSYTESDLWLEIPTLGVQMDIVGVPQANGTWDVTWLGGNAGWLQGSAFPTWAGNSVITGHVWNADNTVGPFYALNSLWYGDRIIVHAFGTEYVYEVRTLKQVRPDNTAAMLKHEELPWLTLVTCRGYNEATDTYRYRLLVSAVLVDVK